MFKDLKKNDEFQGNKEPLHEAYAAIRRESGNEVDEGNRGFLQVLKGGNKKHLFFIAFLCLVIINPWGISPYTLAKYASLLAVIGLTILFVGSSLLFKKNIKLEINPQFLFYSILVICSFIISTLISPTPIQSFWGLYDAFSGLYTLIFLIFGFWLFYNFFQKDTDFQHFFGVITALGLIASIYGLLQKLGVDPIPHATDESFVGRIYSFMGHPNFLGQFLIFPIWTGFYLFQDQGKKWPIFKILLLIGELIMLTALIFTQNRATFLALIITALFYIMHKKFHSWQTRAIIIILTLSITLTGLYLLFPQIRSLSTRVELWRGAFELFLQHPIIGYGPNTFYQSFQLIMTPNIFNFEPLYSTPANIHNLLLSHAYERGFFGIILDLFAIIYFTYLFCGKSLYDKISKISFFAIISLLISLQFSFSSAELTFLAICFFAILLRKTGGNTAISISNPLLTKFIGILFVIIAVHPLLFSINALRSDIILKESISNFLVGQSSKEVAASFEYAQNLNPHFSYHYETPLFLLTKTYTDSPVLLTDFLQKLSEISGKDFKYYLRQAALEEHNNNPLEADKSYQAAVSLAPNNPWVYTNLGNFYDSINESKKAISSYEKLSTLQPNKKLWEDRIFRKTNYLFIEAMNNLNRLKQ